MVAIGVKSTGSNNIYIEKLLNISNYCKTKLLSGNFHGLEHKKLDRNTSCIEVILLQSIKPTNSLLCRQCASLQLQQLAKNTKLVKFLQEDDLNVNCEREIYQPGSPRLVSMCCALLS